MEFLTKPAPFVEAVKKLGSKRRVARDLSSAEWREIPTALRERAFFSAHMESARWLQQAQNTIRDFLESNRQGVTLPDGTKSTSLKAGGRESFVHQMRALFGGGPDEGGGAITNTSASTRLRLIFTTQTRQAWGFGHFKEGNQPEILDAWPAQRFIRGGFVQEPRPLHEANEGAVRLKDDHDFWRSMNQPEIGGFDVPYPPFGFNSQMDVEDVTREEAEALGLLKPGEQIENPEIGFNEQLAASTRGLSPEMIGKLRAGLGEEAVFEKDKVHWLRNPKDGPEVTHKVRWRGEPDPNEAKPEVVLSSLDRQSLNRYTTQQGPKLNARLRAATETGADLDAVANLRNALAKLPAYKGEVVRGATFPPEWIAANLVPGNAIQLEGFTSASITKPYKGNVFFNIRSTSGRIIWQHSERPKEREVLFDYGTQFRVLNVVQKGGAWFIDAEEL